MKKSSFSILNVVLFIILAFYSVLMLFMLGWSFISSVKTQGDFTVNPLSLPQFGWHFDNYSKAFEAITIRLRLEGGGFRDIYLMEMFGYSLLFSVGCAFFGTISPCVVAYLVAKFNKKLNHVLYAIVIFTMIVPIVGNLPSMLQVLETLQLHNTLWGVWLMKANFMGLYFLVFYGMFKSISWEYAEAAIMDGAGHFRIFFNIMIPLAKNTIATIFILLFIQYWNDYQTPLIYIPDMPTAAYGLYTFINGNKVNGLLQTPPIQLAGGMVLLFPILVMFLLLKDRLMGNISVGGLKG
ncbi:MAG: carbohydrate ABC transporter permease [Clostridiales bacterium]|nr:carbohydrate ABC transporter permease [Clostridiales bacterium]